MWFLLNLNICWIFNFSGDDGTDFIASSYSVKNGDENDISQGLVSHSYWQQMIYAHYSDQEALESRCSKRCLVSDDNTCNFYTTANGYCQLGRFNSRGNQYKGPIDDLTVFQLKNSIGI